MLLWIVLTTCILSTCFSIWLAVQNRKQKRLVDQLQMDVDIVGSRIVDTVFRQEKMEKGISYDDLEAAKVNAATITPEMRSVLTSQCSTTDSYSDVHKGDD